MGANLSKALGKLFQSREMRLLMLGLDAAGKTTILYKLKLDQSVTTIPTVGFNVETVTYKNVKFNVWDVGGQDKIRPLWRHYYTGTQGLVFVVDSCDRERIDEARQELHRILSDREMKDCLLLVFANKQDLPGAMSPAEVTEKLGLHRMRDRLWYVHPSCATTGEGLFEGLQWLSNTVRRQPQNPWLNLLSLRASIFCILESETDDVNNAFSVNLAKTKTTVYDLKKAIKAEADALTEHQTRSLILYRTSIPQKENFEANVKTALQTKLGVPGDKLETIFPTGPEEGMVHIIVQLPSQPTFTTPPNPIYPPPILDTTPTRGGQPTYMDPDTVDKIIADFVLDLRPKIAEFLRSPQCLPAWVPDGDDKTQAFYRQINIPDVNNRPSLLLHDLGKYPNPNVAGLFGGKTHRIVCETSGAGKTRVVFEGLCQYWGFYFVAAQGADRIGSRDLESMILTMPQSPNWTNDIFHDPSLDKVVSADRTNEDIAFRRIFQVLLARWIIFDTFINVAKELNGEALPESLKRQWLFFQILPLVSVDDMDPFLALSRRLIGVGSDVLSRLQEPLSPRKVLGSAFNSSFYYVLDEAQIAGGQYMGSFADGGCQNKRPVLRPIVRLFANPSSLKIRIIVSGTGFSLELFKTLLASGVGKVDLWPVFHTTGCFGDKKVQETYVSRYLPPSFLASNSGIALTNRMYNWLRGRYRFTAGYIEELLIRAWKEEHPISPHKLLDAYVDLYTSYHPIDGDKILLDDEPALVGSLGITGFRWEKLKQDQHLMKELSCSIFDYVTRGQYPLWYKSRSELVEHGIARFIDEGNNVVVQEPLALVGIAHQFAAEGSTLEGEINHTMQKNKGQALEQTLVLALTRIFRHGARLNEIFEFHEEIPDWASCTAQIVSRDARHVEVFDLITAEPVVTSTGIAYSANGLVEVEHWLRNGGAGWCIPGRYMGPDLMAWLRLSDGRLLLLVIQAKCFTSGSNDKYLSSHETADAIRSLSPRRYFSHLSKRDTVDSMLDAINGPDARFTSDVYNILRVIAAYPLDANLHSESKEIKKALEQDHHPLATLRHLPLVACLANLGSPSVLESLTMALQSQPDRAEAESNPANLRRKPDEE